MLADMGAEVVKIEPFAGDQFRQPMEGANFFNFNRNKRGIALNLKTKEGKEIVLKLAKEADVLVENFVPGAMDRLGLGYEALSQLNPRIVYCSISGFGQSGPYRDRPAYEPILQAMSGIMDSTGEPDRPPVRIRPAMIDYCTGANAAFAIAAALFGRQKTGRGQRIDVALLDVALYAMGPFVTQFERKGELPERAGSAQPSGGAIQNFETRDGLIYIVAGTDHMWKNLCNALIIKPKQIGTVSETIEAAKLAKSYNWKIMVSNRGGETKDDFIADLAVGIGAEFIKSGAPFPKERMAKYNRLVKIEEELQK